MSFNRLAWWIRMRVLSATLVACILTASALNTATGNPNQVAPNAVQSLFVAGTGLIFTSSSQPAPIQGMQLTLPPLSKQVKYALVTFSAPNLLAQDETSCSFSIYGGATQYGTGVAGDLIPNNSYAMLPLSITTRIPLGRQAQIIQVDWSGFAGNGPDYCELDSFYSLSAILTIN